jgi:uncharacterized protein with HEPN domain
MKHPQRVEDYLEHISEAIDRAASYLQPLQTLEALQRDQQAQDAIVRNIEVIGEAAAKIQKMAPEFVEQHPVVVQYPVSVVAKYSGSDRFHEVRNTGLRKCQC